MSDPSDPRLVPLAGSDRPALSGAEPPPAGIAPDERIQATVVLRRRTPLPDGPLPGGGPSDRTDFGATYGADSADVELATRRFAELGVEVLSVDPASRRLRIEAPVAAMERVFGTRLTAAPHPASATPVRARSGGLSVPVELDGVVTAVLGLDDRPQSRAQFLIAAPGAATTSYTPPQLGVVYDFPAGTDGSGQTIAVIELGGGFAQSDLDAYFGGLGLTSPTVTAVGVDGATNTPGADPGGADGEVLLDIEVAGALAPRANQVVYFAPNTDAGFLDAISQAAHADPTPAAMSISWGQSEDDWTAQARTAMDSAFADAAALGVTVTVASGDDGSTDRATDGRPHVDFPAASPHVLACGGTTLTADPATGAVSAETVWNNGPGQGATGGGVSDAFARPDWQSGAGVPAPAGAAPPASGAGAAAPVPAGSAGYVPGAAAASGGRGVPDVSAVADPRTGYQVLVDGKQQVIGGTSAVAPLWAALVARLVQGSGHRLGLLQPRLYAGLAAGTVAAGFRDITVGDNGAYRAAPGWDACTGLGVPVGSALVAVVSTAPS